MVYLSQRVHSGQARVHLMPCRAFWHVRHCTLLAAVIQFHGVTLERCHEPALGITGLMMLSH